MIGQKRLDVNANISDDADIQSLTNKTNANTARLNSLSNSVSEIETDVTEINENINGLKTVAYSGSYNDLNDKPITANPYVYMTQEEFESSTTINENIFYKVFYPNGVELMYKGIYSLSNYYTDSFVCSDYRCLPDANPCVVIPFNVLGRSIVTTIYAGGTTTDSRICYYYAIDIIFLEGFTNVASSVFKTGYALGPKKITLPSSITTIEYNSFQNDRIENIIINKPQDSISGAPWGATNATIVWNG